MIADFERVPLWRRIALSSPEAAEMLGLSDKSIRRLVEIGALARLPHTQRLLIARVELDRFAASGAPAEIAKAELRLVGE